MILLILKPVAIDNELSWTIQDGTAVKFEYFEQVYLHFWLCRAAVLFSFVNILTQW